MSLAVLEYIPLGRIEFRVTAIISNFGALSLSQIVENTTCCRRIPLFLFCQQRSSSNLFQCDVAKFRRAPLSAEFTCPCFENKMIYCRENRIVGIIAMCGRGPHSSLFIGIWDFLRDAVLTVCRSLDTVSACARLDVLGSTIDPSEPDDEQIIPWTGEGKLKTGGERKCNYDPLLPMRLSSRSIPQIWPIIRLLGSTVLIYEFASDCE